MGKTESSEVRVPFNGLELIGNLTVPRGTKGIVLFAHGSGSSRFSPRNQFVAQVLQKAGLGTLLLDLLTPEEEEIDDATAELRFNIPFLAERLVAATDFMKQQKKTNPLSLGYFGASTGAAAALLAAAERPKAIKAIVSRGGRPDLAMGVLLQIKAPTLLIVGGWDEPVIEMNQAALEKLSGPKELKIVPEATHLFEEPGKLGEVAELACDWFKKYLL